MGDFMKYIVVVLIATFALEVAGKDTDAPYVAVGQGIAVPAYTSPINFSHGFTYTNPAVAAYYDGIQLSLEHATADEEDSNQVSGSGAEFAVGTGKVGLGVGYYERDCDNCEGKAGAIAGFALSGFSAGIGYHEDDTYSAGVIIGASNSHRVGLTVDWQQGPDDNDDVRSYGVGYGYVGNSVIFTLEASKKENETESPSDKIIMLTPGLEVQAQNVALSVSHDTYLNDENETHEANTWFGAGFNFKSGSFSLYHDYVNEWAFVLAFKF